MRYFLIPDSTGKLVKVGAQGFTPPNSIQIPPELESEDQEWLKVVEVEGEFGELQSVVQVDDELKAQVLQEREAAALAQAQQEAIVNTLRNAIRKGQDIIERFTLENMVLGITQDGETERVLNVMGPSIVALQSGSLHAAIARIKAIPAQDRDLKYITDARLLQAVNELEEYLGLELSTEV